MERAVRPQLDDPVARDRSRDCLEHRGWIPAAIPVAVEELKADVPQASVDQARQHDELLPDSQTRVLFDRLAVAWPDRLEEAYTSDAHGAKCESGVQLVRCARVPE